ncbi:MAG TPA: DinB family protein [Terriglobales bacterium]|nr:DinB family protein [Terriglobales bacterium]
MSTFLRTLLVCLLATAAALAQENPPTTAVVPAPDNPLSAWNKFAYGRVKDILLRSAEKVPEENYNFKPTDAVRSFGQIVGHLADAQYLFCSIELGEKNPTPKIEQSKTSKADLIAALKDAFAYCDKAYNGMTDASATQMVKLFGNDAPKLDVLTVNNMHNMEHYGNLVTYMRLKNIVPPTSELAAQPQPTK